MVVREPSQALGPGAERAWRGRATGRASRDRIADTVRDTKDRDVGRPRPQLAEPSLRQAEEGGAAHAVAAGRAHARHRPTTVTWLRSTSNPSAARKASTMARPSSLSISQRPPQVAQ